MAKRRRRAISPTNRPYASSKQRARKRREPKIFGPFYQLAYRNVKLWKGVSPTSGIHSKEWADAIAPQPDSLLLCCNWDVFELIIRNLFWDDVFPFWDPAVGKFRLRQMDVDEEEKSPRTEYCALSLTCRQLYVEVVRGGLFHKNVRFAFRHPRLALQYLESINPILREKIRSIRVRFMIVQPRILNTRSPANMWQTYHYEGGYRSRVLKVATICSSLQELVLETFYEFSPFPNFLDELIHRFIPQLIKFRRSAPPLPIDRVCKLKICLYMQRYIRGSNNNRWVPIHHAPFPLTSILQYRGAMHVVYHDQVVRLQKQIGNKDAAIYWNGMQVAGPEIGKCL